MNGTWYYLEGQSGHLNFDTPSLTTPIFLRVGLVIQYYTLSLKKELY